MDNQEEAYTTRAVADGDPNLKRARFCNDADSNASKAQPLETDGDHENGFLDAGRCALQAQAATLSGMFDAQVQEMTLSWESKLERLLQAWMTNGLMHSES